MSIDPSLINEKQVLDHGYVRLVDVMGDDNSPDRDARISTGSEARSEEQKKTLIRFLLRHHHTTPFEGCTLKFEVRAPILVIREWFRHRTFSYNEESGRYKKLDPLYYLPEPERVAYQAKSNHQGSGDLHPEGPKFIAQWKEEQDTFEERYEGLVSGDNVAKELARLNMPVSHYSAFIVTGNLLNWFRFLQLRMAPNAQYEIRVFAEAIYEIGKQYFPSSFEAFTDYWLESVSFSGEEVKLLRQLLASDAIAKLESIVPEPGPKFTKREAAELIEKMKRLIG
jgi:thymidylate synthase (FAD)